MLAADFRQYVGISLHVRPKEQTVSAFAQDFNAFRCQEAAHSCSMHREASTQLGHVARVVSLNKKLVHESFVEFRRREPA